MCEALDKEIAAIPELLGITEVGQAIGWDRRKVHVYWKRGKLPEPATYVGNRPFWTVGQIDAWKAARKESDLNEN